MTNEKPKILFVYYMEPEIEATWNDGLAEAIRILRNDFQIRKLNLFNQDLKSFNDYDFILGWGAWRSPADNFLHRVRMLDKKIPTGLCIGGNAIPPFMENDHNILFYETEWYKPTISHHKNIKHAFGVNRKVFRPLKKADFGASQWLPVWDFVSVGSFSLWKRHNLLLNKHGKRLAIGQIQKNNLNESISIIGDLILGGVAVSDMVEPESLNTIYNLAKTIYIPAEINGGGERAVLEARSAGTQVEVDKDNPKLLSLLESPIWGAEYYAQELKEGILECLSNS